MIRSLLVTSFLICVVHFCSVFSIIEFCESDVGCCVNFTVSKCKSDAPQCLLRRGSSVEVDISFKPSEDVAMVKGDVHGIISGLHVPFPLPNPDGCKDCGITCPLAKDETYDYKTILPIKKAYPQITLTVLWKLLDGNGKTICCAEIPSRITG